MSLQGRPQFGQKIVIKVNANKTNRLQFLIGVLCALNVILHGNFRVL